MKLSFVPLMLVSSALSALILSACAASPVVPTREEADRDRDPAPRAGERTAQVFFFSEANDVVGIAPSLLSVSRTVSQTRPAHGVMDAMLKGPRASEEKAGLSFVSSGITGYHGLKVENGCAEIYLEGTCAPDAALSVTIADLILPSLKQFPTVQYVHIYGPDGSTENPGAAKDSLPACLKR